MVYEQMFDWLEQIPKKERAGRITPGPLEPGNAAGLSLPDGLPD
jgi:hypothetical protein